MGRYDWRSCDVSTRKILRKASSQNLNLTNCPRRLHSIVKKSNHGVIKVSADRYLIGPFLISCTTFIVSKFLLIIIASIHFQGLISVNSPPFHGHASKQ